MEQYPKKEEVVNSWEMMPIKLKKEIGDSGHNPIAHNKKGCFYFKDFEKAFHRKAQEQRLGTTLRGTSKTERRNIETPSISVMRKAKGLSLRPKWEKYSIYVQNSLEGMSTKLILKTIMANWIIKVAYKQRFLSFHKNGPYSTDESKTRMKHSWVFRNDQWVFNKYRDQEKAFLVD